MNAREWNEKLIALVDEGMQKGIATKQMDPAQILGCLRLQMATIEMIFVQAQMAQQAQEITKGIVPAQSIPVNFRKDNGRG